MKAFAVFLGLLSFNCIHAGQDEEVQLDAPGCTLKGTLSVQDVRSEAGPLVILISGSGPTDRNGNNPQMENNSLLYFSEMLVKNGFSTLRYDKRSIAESRIENFDQRDLSFDDFIDDAVLWTEKFAADDRFTNIILAGHSQGSLIALCAANKCKEVSAVISIAGAGEPISEVLKWQLSATLSPEIQGMVDAKLDTLAAGDTLKHVPDYLVNMFHRNIQPFLISWIKYDPAKQANQLSVPLLIINGTTDVQVTVEQAELLKSANENAELVLIKNMNHILKFTKEKNGMGQLELYSDPEVPLHKKLSKAVIPWLEKQR